MLHRLSESRSGRQAHEWREDYMIEGVESLGLHQMYRTMAWLGEPLAPQLAPVHTQSIADVVQSDGVRELCVE